MFRIDDPSALGALPTPAAAGTPGFFTEGNPGTGVPATRVRADWLNQVQEELLNVIVAAALTPSKTDNTQLLAAIRGIGMGYSQSLQDLTASRAFSTTYTNTTGKPIFIWAAGSVVTTGAAVKLTVSGVSTYGTSDFSGGTAGFISAISAVVPPGATYSLGVSLGTVGAVFSWVELR